MFIVVCNATEIFVYQDENFVSLMIAWSSNLYSCAYNFGVIVSPPPLLRRSGVPPWRFSPVPGPSAVGRTRPQSGKRKVHIFGCPADVPTREIPRRHFEDLARMNFRS